MLHLFVGVRGHPEICLPLCLPLGRELSFQLVLAITFSIDFIGRGGGIRTRDPLLPKQMRYQAALRPVGTDLS